MANTPGISHDWLEAILDDAIDGIATLKAALYYTSATITPDTVGYTDASTPAGQVNESGYTPGGVAVPNTAGQVVQTNGVAHWTPSGSISYGTMTGTAFSCCMIYDTGRSNLAVGVFTFTEQSITSSSFSLTMPTNDDSTALIRIG